MVDEILRGFLDDLFGTYRADRRPQGSARARPSRRSCARPSRRSTRTTPPSRSTRPRPAIWPSSHRFGYIGERLVEFRDLWHDVLRAGVADGSFRADLDVELAYRFLRDTVWVGVGWYRPGGKLTIDDIADQYLSIVLDGITSGAPSETKGAHRA